MSAARSRARHPQAVTSVNVRLRPLHVRYLSRILVFLVFLPVLINLGGYFDYSQGYIPVNVPHCNRALLGQDPTAGKASRKCTGFVLGLRLNQVVVSYSVRSCGKTRACGGGHVAVFRCRGGARRCAGVHFRAGGVHGGVGFEARAGLLPAIGLTGTRKKFFVLQLRNLRRTEVRTKRKQCARQVDDCVHHQDDIAK